MTLRLSVTPLREADAYAARDARTDTTVIVLSCRLTLGQLLVTAGHLARRVRDVPPGEDVGIRLGVGDVTAMSPIIADRAIVDLMDRPDLDVEGVETLLDLIVMHYGMESGGGYPVGLAPGPA